ILLDAMLPEIHGFDIAKRLKGTQRYGHIPIVMISANYRGWQVEQDLQAGLGIEAFIEKPFKISDVVRAVDDALAKQQSQWDKEEVSIDAEDALNLGIQAYRDGDLEAAIDHLRRGTQIDPLAYRLHYHLGLLYAKGGRIYDAIQELETAIQI